MNTVVETTSGYEAKATVTLQPVGEMGISLSPAANACVVMDEQPTVCVSLVYTAAVTEETEVWWCDNWKMLWNNQTRVLWQTV